VTVTVDDVPQGIPSPGDILSGKYQIERVIGMGGMGVVLAAQHVTLGQRVAVKLLLPHIAKLPEAGKRFLREARASTNLRSEHVARVLDVGTQDNGSPYMVMEYLEGRDLHQLASTQSRLPIAASIDYVLQAAEALAEAHTLGIVHRDLKPANLFLTTHADGSALVKVLDFGISKATLPGESGITATDAVLGSPGYMSPEQIRSAKHVDQRADIWGLGVSLYELLTGQPPFDGASVAAVSVQIVLETPKLTHELRPDVPEGLSRVVARCLEKDPAKRYPNMAELAAALLPYGPSNSSTAVERIRRIGRGSMPFAATLAASDPDLHSQVSAGTNGTWESPKGAAQRKRAVALGVGGVLVVGGLFASVFVLGRHSADRPAGREIATGRAGASVAPADQTPMVQGDPAPTSSVAAEPVAQPERVVSAASAPVAASSSAPAKRRPSPQRAVCPKGQSPSNGHCCPGGLVWQKGGCDRPLAVSLP
jgi:eukaryotic-like serine/threonine-protein kinase